MKEKLFKENISKCPSHSFSSLSVVARIHIFESTHLVISLSVSNWCCEVDSGAAACRSARGRPVLSEARECTSTQGIIFISISQFHRQFTECGGENGRSRRSRYKSLTVYTGIRPVSVIFYI